jgi:hypothetical protein
VTAADDGDPFSGVARALPAEDVRDAVENVGRGGGFSQPGQTVGAEWIRRIPGADASLTALGQ